MYFLTLCRIADSFLTLSTMGLIFPYMNFLLPLLRGSLEGLHFV